MQKEQGVTAKGRDYVEDLDTQVPFVALNNASGTRNSIPSSVKYFA